MPRLKILLAPRNAGADAKIMSFFNNSSNMDQSAVKLKVTVCTFVF